MRFVTLVLVGTCIGGGSAMAETYDQASAGPFQEDWLVSRCGKLAIVPLHSVPHKAEQQMEIDVTGSAKPAELR